MKTQLILLLSFASLIIPPFAIADEITPEITQVQHMGAKCAIVTTKVQDLTQRLTNDENLRVHRHQNVIDRVNRLITKLKTAGINTDKLQSDVDTLTKKKATWDSAYSTLLDKLNATKTYGCGTSQGQYAQAVKDARAQRTVMHNANRDFWTFVKTTVISDMKTARTQLNALTPAQSVKPT